MKFENISVYNFENALRGMRNPMNSWNKTDSYINKLGLFIFGKNDLDLAQRLIKAGSVTLEQMMYVIFGERV